MSAPGQSLLRPLGPETIRGPGRPDERKPASLLPSAQSICSRTGAQASKAVSLPRPQATCVSADEALAREIVMGTRSYSAAPTAVLALGLLFAPPASVAT